ESGRYGEKAEADRREDVQRGAHPVAVPHEVKRFEAERRKRREPAENPDEQESARVRRQHGTPVRGGETRQKTDQQRARYVHDQRAPRKRAVAEAGHRPADRVTAHAAERATDGDPQIAHLSSRVLVDPSGAVPPGTPTGAHHKASRPRPVRSYSRSRVSGGPVRHGMPIVRRRPHLYNAPVPAPGAVITTRP